MAAHIIGFKADGSIYMQNTPKLNDKVDVTHMILEEVHTKEVHFEAEEDECSEWTARIDEYEVLNFVEANSYVAIRAPSNSLELFYLMQVVEKGIAESNLYESAKEHCILEGEPYVIARWLSLIKEGKKTVKYKEVENAEMTLIHIKEIFSTNIKLDDNMQMDITDYRMLCCGVF